MKKLVLLATGRYSINIVDFYMFYRRTEHQIVAILYHYSCQYNHWWQENEFFDPARDCLFDPLDSNRFPFFLWYHIDDLMKQLDRLDFDFVCMGNGTGHEQEAVIEYVGRGKCLFSEYGWLPWSEHFYISRNGCGRDSELASYRVEDIAQMEIWYQEIDCLVRKLDQGANLPYRDFIYVPLQKDVNDFKFQTSPFASNEAFLDFIHEVTPSHFDVLVKPHPLYNKSYDLGKYGRFIDLSGKNYNKKQIYNQMYAMICINSTSILEALIFSGKIFAYGEDVFNNKDIVNHRIFKKKEFVKMLALEIPQDIRLKFVSLLMERQINRRRCLVNDLKYIGNHYWNQRL